MLMQRKRNGRPPIITEAERESVHMLDTELMTLKQIHQETGIHQERLRKYLASHSISYKKSGSSMTGSSNPRWSGSGDITGALWNAYRTGARNRNIGFDITVEEGWQLFLDQDGICPYTGYKLTFPSKWSLESLRLGTASLDRIDSSLDYEVGNCEWIHKMMQVVKHVKSRQETLDLCRRVTEYQKEKECSVLTSVVAPTTIMPIVKCSISSPMSLDTFRHQVRKQIPELSSIR